MAINGSNSVTFGNEMVYSVVSITQTHTPTEHQLKSTDVILKNKITTCCRAVFNTMIVFTHYKLLSMFTWDYTDKSD